MEPVDDTSSSLEPSPYSSTMAQCRTCLRSVDAAFSFCPYCASPLSAHDGSRRQERRIVTVLFADMVGSTSAAEAQDPEDVRARMSRYHAVLSAEVERFGGTVEKFAGDAVLAVFGAPTAHEDDAERAVRAGGAIVAALTGLEPPIEVRVGVNTGECLVDLDARPQAGEAYVTGDVVNTAARIEAAAPPGAVLVGSATYQVTRRVFDYSEQPSVAAKGKRLPIEVWRAGAARARLGVDVLRNLDARMIGRDIDAAMLRAAYEKVVRDRSTHLVTVTGEAGLGKSRLVAELRREVHERPDVSWYQGRCLPYGDGVTFWALGEVVKTFAGIFDTDTRVQATAKLNRRLRSSALASGSAIPERLRDSLLPLLGLESGEAPPRDELYSLWRTFLESLCWDGPAVILVEDLHWADNALLDFLETVADLSPEVPLLVLTTARPELFDRKPDWGTSRLNGTTIRLNRLSDSETAELISERLGRAVLPVETQRAVLDRVGGNPLYAEEFAAVLRDGDLLTDHGELRPGARVPLPDSLQQLMAGRLDSLSPVQRDLVQDAAVVGLVFWTGALVAMSGRERAAVEEDLRILARRDLVRPLRTSTMRDEPEYTFRHAITRDVAYQQLAREPRAIRHLAATQWLERQAADRVTDVAEVLAFHSAEALRLAGSAGAAHLLDQAADSTRRYSLLAAKRAMGTDTAAALRFLNTAAELTTPGTLEHSRTLAKVGRVLFDARRFREARTALETALPALQACDHPDRVDAAVFLFNVYFAVGEPTGPMVEVMAEAADSMEPGPLTIRAQEWVALSQVIRQTTPSQHEAIATATRAIDQAAALGLPPPLVAAASRGRARAALGDPDGLQELESAVAALKRGPRTSTSIGMMQWLAGARHHWLGSPAELEVREELDEIARQRGLRYLMSFGLAERARVLMELGRLREAAEFSELVAEGEAQQRFAFVAAAIAKQELGTFSHDDRRRVEATRPIDAEDLRHQLGRALVLATAELDAGDLGAARRELLPLPDLPLLAEREGAVELLPRMARCALAADSPDLFDALRSVPREPATPLRRCIFQHVDGLLALSAERFDEAAAHLSAARAGWSRLGQRLEQAYAAQALTEALDATGVNGSDVEAELRDLLIGMGVDPGRGLRRSRHLALRPRAGQDPPLSR